MTDWVGIAFAGVFALAGTALGYYLSERSAVKRETRSRVEKAGRAAVLLHPMFKRQLEWATALPSTPELVSDPEHQLIVPPKIFMGLQLETITEALVALPPDERADVAGAIGFAQMLAQSVGYASSVSKQMRGATWADDGRAWTSDDSKDPVFAQVYRFAVGQRAEFVLQAGSALKRLEPRAKSVL